MMKVLQQLFGLIQKLLAKSLLKGIIAIILSLILALVCIKLVEGLTDDPDRFLAEIDHQLALLYLLFVIINFAGIMLIQIISGAIKVVLISKEKK